MPDIHRQKIKDLLTYTTVSADYLATHGARAAWGIVMAWFLPQPGNIFHPLMFQAKPWLNLAVLDSNKQG